MSTTAASVPELSVPPEWLEPLTRSTSQASSIFAKHRATPEQATARQAAVLMLFGGPLGADPTAPGGLPADAEILLTQRASTLRQHSGQVAFPGGAYDPGDDWPIGTALREAAEETGLEPGGVASLSILAPIFVPPSGFEVTAVLAYWQQPSAVGVVDPAETERVVRVPVRELIDPANRFQISHPAGYKGPAFRAGDMLVWGFTGGLLAAMLAFSGWEREWDHHDVRDLETTLAQFGEGVR